MYAFQGSYKDVMGRVAFFEKNKQEYRLVEISADEPLNIESVLKNYYPTHILMEYSHHIRILLYLRQKYPDAFIAMRSHNIEPLQLMSQSAFTAKKTPRLLYGALRMFYAELLYKQKADVIYSINEWEVEHYWSQLPGRAVVKWLPYFAPDFILRGRTPEKVRSVIACTPGKMSSPRQRDMIKNFIAFAGIARCSFPQYSYVITGDYSDSDMKIPDFIRLSGMIDDMGGFLSTAKAVAILSPIGYGFKTSISDALANGCCCLLHPTIYDHTPSILRQGCAAVDSLSIQSINKAMESIENSSGFSDIDAQMRHNAFSILDNDFGNEFAGVEHRQYPPTKKFKIGFASVANALYNIGVWRMYASGAQVLFYHRIVDKVRNPLLKSGALELAHFIEQLNFLQKNRLVIGLHELLDEMASGRDIDNRHVVLSFDDALASVHRYVLPELHRRKLPFIVGIPSALPDTGRSLWEYEAALLVSELYRRGRLLELFEGLRDADKQCGAASGRREKPRIRLNRDLFLRPDTAINRFKTYLRSEISSEHRIMLLDWLVDSLYPELRRPLAEEEFRVMTWGEIKDIVSAGGTLVSHGHWHHPHNETITELSRYSELSDSKKTIQEKTGVKVDAFIWPEGISSEISKRIAMTLDYKCLLSTQEAFITSVTTPYDIPRVSGEWPLSQMLWNTRNLR